MKGWLAFFLISVCLTAYSQLRFEHIDIEDGLSQNSVTAILQDRYGYMWFGTEHGLNKYDGYTFEVFSSNAAQGSLLGDQVWSIYEDSRHKLWVGTDEGLNLLERDENRFVSADSILTSVEKPIEGVVAVIYEDGQSNIWLGTWNDGIYKIDSARSTLQHFPTKEKTVNTMAYGIRSILVKNNWLYATTWEKGMLKMDTQTGQYEYLLSSNSDLKSNFLNFLHGSIEGEYWWLTTRFGIQRFNPATMEFQSTGSPILDTLKFPGKILKVKNQLWVGAYGGGLYLYDFHGHAVKNYSNDENDPYSLANNLIIDVVMDQSGCFWLGSWSGGLNKYCPDAQKFTCCQDQYSIKNVFSIAPHQGSLYFGTYGYGLFRLKNNKRMEYIPGPANYILDLLADSKGNLWVAYDGGTIGRLNNITGQVEYDEQLSQQIGSTQIHRLKEDSKGNIWVGTQGNGAFGISDGHALNLTTGSSPALNNNFVYAFCESSDGKMFLGTYGGGLNIYDPNASQVTSFEHIQNDATTLPSNNVWDIFEDSKKRIWVATSHGFSQCLSGGGFKNYNEADGLVNSWVYCIVEDKKGLLWLSTNGGISCFNPENGSFRNFKSYDGLQSNEFNANAKFKDRQGNIYFGGINGYNRFDPDEISYNTKAPLTVFTKLVVNGKDATTGNAQYVNNGRSKHISQLPKLNLNYKDRTFSLEFAGLHFMRPEENRYKYMLMGFDKEWVEAGKRNFVTYTNLDPGDYMFQVKSANSDGLWSSHVTSLNITVLPPPWLTWWAYLIYTFAFGLIVALVIRAFIIRERLKSGIRLEKLEVEKMHEIDQMKTRFFTNISHEFRTPLTLILTPLDKLMQKPYNKGDKKTLSIIKGNAQRLLTLINELMDLSKLEAGHLKLQVSANDLPYFCKSTAASFQSLAESKGIQLNAFFPGEETLAYFDYDKIEKVIINLLGNAVKFTPHYGQVKFVGELEDKWVKFEVENTGATIDPEDQQKVFNRFYRSKNENLSHEGTGVGLALVKELVELHGGTIELYSGQGITRFRVKIPKDKMAYDSYIIVGQGQPLSVPLAAEVQSMENPSVDRNFEIGEKPLVLVVEDNQDLRSYISGSLAEQHYQVRVAENGRQGLEMALEVVPDLVVTDFMMPVMDGLDMMRRIKEDQKTDHIPVVMLTAKTELESRLLGIATGADHYLGKPFDMNELEIRIKSLLDQRARVREHYKLEFLTNPLSADNIKSADDVFLNKLTTILKENSADNNFSVDQFAREMAMSRVQLHRKLKAKIGCSASEFIRSYRLKKAHQYLKARKGSVSEIAYAVGFNNLSYFTKTFKSMYQMNPSELLD